MFTVAIYHIETKELIAMIPLVLHDPTRISMLESILHKDYDYMIFCDTDPVLGEDQDGDIILKPNSFIINSELLK